MINAVQAMDSGGSLEVDVRPADDTMKLQIFDNGRGIPSKNQREIFKPFFTTRRKGTGLGLAIADKIVQAHQGQIECSARETGGTVFTVTLPCQQ